MALKGKKELKRERIFSGNYSKVLWNEINSAKTVKDLRDALYAVCCRLQELEAKIARDRKSDHEYSEIMIRRHGIIRR